MPGSSTTTTEEHSHYTTTRVEVANLGTRVGALEQGMNSIGTKLDGLVNLMSSRGQTNWSHILGAGSLLTAILGLVGAVVYQPIQSGQTRNELAILGLASKTEGTFDKMMSRMETREERIVSQMVPRQEHELFWKNYERTLDRVVKRLDRIEYSKQQNP